MIWEIRGLGLWHCGNVGFAGIGAKPAWAEFKASSKFAAEVLLSVLVLSLGTPAGFRYRP